MMQELLSIRNTLRDLRTELAAVDSDLKFRKFIQELKANFNPDQPRDERGRWASTGSGQVESEELDPIGSSEFDVSAVFADVEGIPLERRIELMLSDDDAHSLVQNVGATVRIGDAYTGIQKIDQTTDKLIDVLRDTMSTMDFIPGQTAGAYGVAVHVSFGNAVKALNLEGIGRNGIEQSFVAGDIADYGVAGSIRTDVILRDVAERVLAIYDVKTGGAVLRPSRAEELRSASGASPYTPVIELHFQRGANLKHEPIEARLSIGAAAFDGHDGLRSFPSRRRNGTYPARISPRYNAA